VGPRAVLGALERDEPLAPAGNPTSISLNVKPRHYTHYAAPAPKTRRKLCTRVLVFKCVRKIEKRLLDSSCLSVRPHGITLLPLDRFSRNLIFEYF